MANEIEILDRAIDDVVASIHLADAFKQPGLVIDAMASTGGDVPKDQAMGEGFAYFRWHCLKYPTIRQCCGYKTGFGICFRSWTGNNR